MVTEIIEVLIDIYISEVRPTLVTKNSMDFVFLNSTNGNRLRQSNTSTNFSDYWCRCGGKPQISSQFLSHYAATVAKEKSPEAILLLAKSMKHNLSTFSKTYDSLKGTKKDDSGVWMILNNTVGPKIQSNTDTGCPGDRREGGKDLQEPSLGASGWSSSFLLMHKSYCNIHQLFSIYIFMNTV